LRSGEQASLCKENTTSIWLATRTTSKSQITLRRIPRQSKVSMKKFFFDDVREAPSHEWVVARTVPEAKEILLKESFDVMSLDHDIGYQ